MSLAIYPGSFNPWHRGHQDILDKALQVFDQVVVACGTNGSKEPPRTWSDRNMSHHEFQEVYGNRVALVSFQDKLLVDFIREINAGALDPIKLQDGPKTLAESENYRELNLPVTAVIRGLRNGDDLQYEMNQQYWYEDLGLEIPVVYFITDRTLSHISSSAIRQIESIKRRT